MRIFVVAFIILGCLVPGCSKPRARNVIVPLSRAIVIDYDRELKICSLSMPEGGGWHDVPLARVWDQKTSKRYARGAHLISVGKNWSAVGVPMDDAKKVYEWIYIRRDDDTVVYNNEVIDPEFASLRQSAVPIEVLEKSYP